MQNNTSIKVDPVKTATSTEETIQVKTWILESLQNQINELKKDNTLLKDVANKRMMAKLATERNPEEKAVSISLLWKKVITSWSSMLDNEMYWDVQPDWKTVVWTERQTRELHFSDWTSLKMSYHDATRKTTSTEKLNVISISTKNGEIFYEVEYKGKTYTIEKTFIN